MEGFNGRRFGQHELVADGHAMTEAPLHFGRPVSLRRVSESECLQNSRMLGMYLQDFSGMILMTLRLSDSFGQIPWWDLLPGSGHLHLLQKWIVIQNSPMTMSRGSGWMTMYAYPNFFEDCSDKMLVEKR